MSLIKSLLSNDGDARVVIWTTVSTEEDEGVREGSRHRCEKLPVRFYRKKQKKISSSSVIVSVGNRRKFLSFIIIKTYVTSETGETEKFDLYLPEVIGVVSVVEHQ